MRLDRRQQALLRAMGVRVWAAPASEPVSTPAAVALAQPDQAAEMAPPTSPVMAPSARAKAPELSQTPSPSHAATSPRSDAALIAQMDWPSLRQAVAGCTACGLCESRQQTVFGSGPLQAHWLVVGEAPGEQEDRQGLPFVGPSGELLSNMFAALQLSRADEATPDQTPDPARQVYIANTLKCRPPSNRNPSAAEMAQCEPFLLRQIVLLQPRVIVAVGAFAVKALLGSDEPVGKLRGRVHSYGGVPLVVSYHPAYLLRQPQEKAKAWADWCLAADVAERGA